MAHKKKSKTALRVFIFLMIAMLLFSGIAIMTVYMNNPLTTVQPLPPVDSNSGLFINIPELPGEDTGEITAEGEGEIEENTDTEEGVEEADTDTPSVNIIQGTDVEVDLTTAPAANE